MTQTMVAVLEEMRNELAADWRPGGAAASLPRYAMERRALAAPLPRVARPLAAGARCCGGSAAPVAGDDHRRDPARHLGGRGGVPRRTGAHPPDSFDQFRVPGPSKAVFRFRRRIGCTVRRAVVKLKITIDDKTYEVDVEAAEPEAPAPPRGYVDGTGCRCACRRAAPAAAQAVLAAAGERREGVPQPGVGHRGAGVAQVGQKIQAGDVLLVLEAMKMETNITSPVAGKVAAIKVAAGESVQSGQVVVEFE